MTSLATLPPELLGAILDQTDPEDLQSTCLSLMHVFPRLSISPCYLYTHIRLRRLEQPAQLYRVLRFGSQAAEPPGTGGLDAKQRVRTFKFESFSADADVVINLVHILTNVEELTLYIGPNFTPEHLEEMFSIESDPRQSMRSLRYISLRFRPYVQKASYYQFLKGAYFDSTLLALERWPAGRITSLSIVQEPHDKSKAPRNFAQPLCFFRLDPLTDLVTSPVCSTITAFRLRIPARQIAPFIYARQGSLPAVKLLDLSTCNILDSEITHILTRFPGLHHLLLDHCANARLEEDYASLGKACALAGVQRAKLREKKLRAWLERNYFSASNVEVEDSDQPITTEPARRPRRGRRGLATATISLRDRNSPLDSVASRGNVPKGAIPKMRIMPSLPVLQGVAIGTVHMPSPEREEIMYLEFERGWNEGVSQHLAVCSRLKTSWSNGVRVLRFADSGEEPDDDVGFNGLVDLQAITGGVMGDQGNGQCPTLCLAGPSATENHPAGCSHDASSIVWDD